MSPSVAVRGTVRALTWSGRKLIRRVRTGTPVADNREQVARVLASIGAYQLGLAELAREHAVRGRPELAEPARNVLDGLAATISAEIGGFVDGVPFAEGAGEARR